MLAVPMRVLMSKLRLLSDSDVEKIATFDITSSLDLYDPRFGNAGNNDVSCPTCNMRNDVCMGHHALLSLGIHMFHPLTYKDSQNIINNTCLKCNTRLCKVFKSRAKRCSNCDYSNPGDYVIHATDMSVAVRPGDQKNNLRAEFLKDGILPEGYVISKILVPPIHLRTPEEMEWSTDVQKLYEQLIVAVRSKKNVCDAYSKILGTYSDPKRSKKNVSESEQIPKKMHSDSTSSGIMGIISGKDGVFRQLMMGKRMERSARAVVIGDPYLKLDQVAVPKAVANAIKVDVSCTKHNIVNLKQKALDGRLWWPGTDDVVNPVNILEGMAFQRALMDGDLTMLNRQPSLSRVSLMCFKVVIRKDDERVFAINPQIASPFNADFDGDEMNLFFLFDQAEMIELCHNTEVFAPVQDVVTGCYIMSEKDVPVDAQVWQDCVVYTSNGDITSQTTFGLLKMCIPDYDGRRLHKRSFKAFRSVDIYALQLVVNRWLSAYGLTVPLKSMVVQPVTMDEDETIDAFKERCITKVRTEMSGTGIMNMIDSGAKGSVVHASHMAVAIGQQYIGGKPGVFCKESYSRGLTPDEFFGHQMAAREGVVRTGVGTANTGYLNRRACKVIADLKVQYNDTVADDSFVSSFFPV